MVLFEFPTLAQARVSVPLLPPRERASTTAPEPTPITQKKILRSELTAIGLEVGTVGIKNTSASDVVGLQLLFGMRANYIYPLGSRVFLRPSIGYFLKPEGEGQVSITQHLVEAGLGIQYALVRKQGFLWHAGLSQRMDYLFTKIAIKDSTSTTPSAFRYRAGTSTGIRFKISQKSDLSFDLEAGVTPFDNFRFQSGFTSGVIFFID
ncbi:MAG: hypothetical protein ACKN9V_07530 [Pseudomonadota bacterium]